MPPPLPATDAPKVLTFTMAPAPRALIIGARFWTRRNGARRLVSMCRLKVASSTSRVDPNW
jgi:hypothetical protein